MAHREGERRSVGEGGERTGVLDRVSIHDRFEGRSRLAEGLSSPIELVVVEVTAADHRPYRSGSWIHRDEKALDVRRVRTCLRFVVPGVPIPVVLLPPIPDLPDLPPFPHPALSIPT